VSLWACGLGLWVLWLCGFFWILGVELTFMGFGFSWGWLLGVGFGNWTSFQAPLHSLLEMSCGDALLL
jgi:hypothetical protein